MDAVAKASLSPTFGSMAETADGVVAILNQFKIGANQAETALSSLNAVAAAYAVESKDIIEATKIAGGTFATLENDIGGGLENFQEFIAMFSTIRSTTRESASTIATGLKTIVGRAQRPQNLEYLREMGVELTDLEGKFIGPTQAILKIGEAFNNISPRRKEFAELIEKLGGIRQIGRTIPLIMNTDLMKEQMEVAKKGVTSLDDVTKTAMESVARQFSQTGQNFKNMIFEFTNTETFKMLTQTVLSLSNAFIELARAFKEVAPLLAAWGIMSVASKGYKAIGGFPLGLGTMTQKVVGKQSGGPTGLLTSGVRGQDTIPLAGKGEYVVKASSVTSRTLPILNALNSGKVSFNQGGTNISQVTRDLIKQKEIELARAEHDKALSRTGPAPLQNRTLASDVYKNRGSLTGSMSTQLNSELLRRRREVRIQEVQELRALKQQERTSRQRADKVAQQQRGMQNLQKWQNADVRFRDIEAIAQQAIPSQQQFVGDPSRTRQLGLFDTNDVLRTNQKTFEFAKDKWMPEIDKPIARNIRQRSFLDRMNLQRRVLQRKFSSNPLWQKRLSQGMGIGAMFGGQAIGDAVGGTTGGAIGGAGTFGGTAAMLGAGLPLAIGAAAYGGLTGGLRANTEQLTKQADEDLLQSTKTLDKAFSDFVKSGSLKDLEQGFKNIKDISSSYNNVEASKTYGLANLYGLAGGGNFEDIGADRTASRLGMGKALWLATKSSFGNEEADKEGRKAGGEAFRDIQRESLQRLSPISEQSDKYISEYIKRNGEKRPGSLTNQMMETEGGAIATAYSMLGHIDPNNNQEVVASRRIQQYLQVYNEAQTKQDKQKAYSDLQTGLQMEDLRGIKGFDAFKSGLINTNKLDMALAKSEAKITSLVESFEDLSASLVRVDDTTKRYEESNRVLSTRMSGGATIEKQTAPNIFGNLRAFSTDEISGGFDNLRSQLGSSTTLDNLQSSVMISESMRRQLPEMLNKAKKMPRLPGDQEMSAQDWLTSELSGNRGDNNFGFNKAGTAGESIREQALESMKKIFGDTEQGGMKLSQMSDKKMRDYIDQLTQDLSGGSAKATKETWDKLVETNNQYIEAVTSAIGPLHEVSSKNAEMAAGIAEYNNQVQVLFGQRKELTLGERLAPTESRLRSLLKPGKQEEWSWGAKRNQRAITGFKGDVSDVGAIQRNMDALTQTRERIQGQLQSNPGNKALIDQLSALELRLAEHQDALKILSNDTTRLIYVQEEMAKIEQQKSAATSAISEMDDLTPTQRRERLADIAANAKYRATGIMPEGLAGKRAKREEERMINSGLLSPDEARKRQQELNKARLRGYDPISDAYKGAIGIETEREKRLKNIAQKGQNIRVGAGQADIDIQQGNIGRFLQGITDAFFGTKRGVKNALSNEAIDKFNQAANKLADNLGKLEKINIPDKIQLEGNHKVEVVINGAAVLQDLQPGIQALILQEINNAMNARFAPDGEPRDNANAGIAKMTHKRLEQV
jgi:TP901 family phage tail tape measure protein